MSVRVVGASPLAAAIAHAVVSAEVPGLVTVAPPAPSPSLLALSPQDWDAALDAHVTAVYRACGEALPGVRSIVNVIAGEALGLAEAVRGLTKALARELAPTARANVVDATGAEPEEVVPLVLFLLSDRASFVTAATLSARLFSPRN